MRLRISMAVMVGLLFISQFRLMAQQSGVQSEFEFALAEAHGNTSLFTSHHPPFRITAEAESSLALHGTGKGTFEEEWVDHDHWQRVIRFGDYESTEMSTDKGAEWRTSTAPRPIRAYELFRLALLHVPGPKTLQSFQVERSFPATEEGRAVTCYAAHKSSPDRFPRRYQWCFDATTGLLMSEDLPLKTHVVFRDYVPFEGKHEFTQVLATVDGLPVLQIHLGYSSLDSHALDTMNPSPAMWRIPSTSETDEMEDASATKVINEVNPKIPNGVSARDNRPVEIRFMVGENGGVLDAAVEGAPTVAMASAALDAARGWTFGPYALNGEMSKASLYATVMFQGQTESATTDITPDPVVPSSSPIATGLSQPMQLAQFRALIKAIGMDEVIRKHIQTLYERERAQFPPWWPDVIRGEVERKMEEVDVAAAYFPSYQKCYDEADARLMIHLAQTPEGYAYIHPALEAESAKQLAGASPAQARAGVLARQHGLNPHILKQLDAADQAYAVYFFGHHRDQVASACVTQVAPAAIAQLSALVAAVPEQVVEAHQTELAAAQSKYAAGHTTQAKP